MAEPWPRDLFRSAVIADEHLTSSQRLVAIVMSEHARERDRASVTYPRLMRATRLSRDTVARCLAALEATGWLVPDGPVVSRRSPTYLLRWSDSRTTDQPSWSDERTTSGGAKSDHRTTDEPSWSDGADRWSDGADRWSDDRTPSQSSSQLSSQSAGARNAPAAIGSVGRASSLPRDREAQEAVDWLVREFAFPLDDARAFVDKQVPSKIERPLAWLRRWDPKDIERKRPRPKPATPTRSPVTHCDHGYRRRRDATPDEICCEVGERERNSPRVRQDDGQGREAAS